MKTYLDNFAHLIMGKINDGLIDNKLLGFEWEIEYLDLVSNTHGAPKNGVMNFRCDPDKPKGYPGFSGRVWFLTEKEHRPKIVFNNFPLSNTHTGSGGCGYYKGAQWENYVIWYHQYNYMVKELYPYSYSYEYYFFLDDYPELYGVLEEERILRKLKDVYGDEHFHKFKWMDEETKQKHTNLMNGNKNALRKI